MGRICLSGILPSRHSASVDQITISVKIEVTYLFFTFPKVSDASPSTSWSLVDPVCSSQNDIASVFASRIHDAYRISMSHLLTREVYPLERLRMTPYCPR